MERFRFGPDGDEIGYEQLLERGFDISGTEGDDALKGTVLADRVRGGDGNDLIEATPGGDWLAGEGGNDIYVVNLGDGMVTIDDVAEEGVGNLLRFGVEEDGQLSPGRPAMARRARRLRYPLRSATVHQQPSTNVDMRKT